MALVSAELVVEALDGADPARLVSHPDWLVPHDQPREAVTARLELLGRAREALTKMAPRVGGPSSMWPMAFELWAPLALRILERTDSRPEPTTPWVQGLLGTQGTGKSTLSDAVMALLSAAGRRAAVLSLDDLYLPLAEREALAAKWPFLTWRGPPGTHDVARMEEVLKAAHAAEPLLLPRFDKAASGGRGERERDEAVGEVDVLLFEGWFVGARALINSPSDPLARFSNEALRRYELAWEQLDALWILRPTDYTLSRRWRLQAERDLRTQGRGSMSDEEVIAFVDYFFRALDPTLHVDPLIAGELSDVTVDLDEDHQPVRVRMLGG